MADARETAEIVRNWSNDKAFQIGMHVMRGNLLPAEASTALSNLAEASISTVLTSVVADYVDRFGTLSVGGVAAVLLGDLASREAYPDVGIDLLILHDGRRSGKNEQVCRSFQEALADLAQDSLLFSPVPPGSNAIHALPLSELEDHVRNSASGEVPALTRARCAFEHEGSDIAERFEEARRQILAECGADDSFLARLSGQTRDPAETGVSAYARMRGGLNDVEKAARYLQLARGGSYLDDPAPSAAAVFDTAGAEPLAQAAIMWRDLQGVMRLVGEEGFDAAAAGPEGQSSPCERLRAGGFRCADVGGRRDRIPRRRADRYARSARMKGPAEQTQDPRTPAQTKMNPDKEY